ncbi:restriction endonuclease subunit S [uncultured Arthrobacter sp.]|uniref:restriction endonuclease subunit S n=1 Tax=uncultured Arthrobacter sp. TaxID=114050 RepID=UPI003216C962
MTMRHGLVPQSEKFKKRVAGADLSQYKVIDRNQLVVGFPIDEAVLAFQRSIPAGIVSPAYGVWDLTDEAETDALYLERFLRSPQAIAYYKAKLQGSTARRRSLPNSVFLDMDVPFPPPDEQRRIAAILDKADELRTKRSQALAHLDTLTQSIFHSTFGSGVPAQSQHPVVKMGDVLVSATYGSSERAAISGDIPILRMGNLTYGGDLDFTDLKYLGANQPDKHLLRNGDVLFNRTNSADLVGKTAMFRGNGPAAYAGYLIRLRTSEDLLPEYLTTFMNLPSTKRLLRNMAKSIVGMANINAKEVQSIRLPLPPIELQQTFANRVAAVERLKATHRKHLVELDALFASLQHRAFKGEL